MKTSYLFVSTFRVICIIGACSMIGYWVYKFHMNKDLTLIEYKAIEEVDDFIYPEPSICFVTPFINNELLNVSDDEQHYHPYLRYLDGDGNYDRYKNINYFEVTPNLADYFEWLMIFWKPGKNVTKSECNGIRNCEEVIKFKNHYNGFWSTYFVKCFSVGIDSQYIKDIRQFHVAFNSEFRNVLSQVSDTVLFFFQPNQFLRPREEPKFIWRKSDNFSNAEMFQITSLELLKRRDKHNDKCLTKWNEYDHLVLKHFLSSVGCRPPYINDDETNFCNTKQKLQQARYNGWSYAKKSKVLNPCQELSLINYKHDFYPSEHEAKDLYLLSVSYPPIIKLIKQSQAVDPHSLIGNIGGYIGLFLGCAIIQLPELITSLQGFIKKKCSGKLEPRKISLKSKKTIKEHRMDEKHFIKSKKMDNETHKKCDGYSVENYCANFNTRKEESLADVFERIDKLEQKWSQQLKELKNDIRSKMK